MLAEHEPQQAFGQQTNFSVPRSQFLQIFQLADRLTSLLALYSRLCFR